MKKLIAGIVLVAVCATLVIAGCKTGRSAYESAPYEVVRKNESFEVRNYPALTVVETTMNAKRDAADRSFMKLFGFISGGNEKKEKIAMTTPVFMSGTEGDTKMAFVMPAKMKPADVPKPADGSLSVKQLPPGRFAVCRFSGIRSAKNEADALAKLREWLAKEQMKTTGTPVYGYFDAPWTPWFMRRNEVMLPVEG